ncbi:MAG: class SAM-dependent methyltransferase [Mucilaginibacter sp.]|nr:class SAM-dependent methyltransferase [Mucilaginibacter sp.]
MIIQSESRVQDEILSAIEAIEKDGKLYQEKNFNLRSQAIDYIEFHIIDRIDALIESTAVYDLMSLKQYAEKIKCHLEDVDTRMFHQLGTQISQGVYEGELLIDLIDEHLDYNLSGFLQQDATGYDNLDMFLNGLLTNQNVPFETKDREPEMIFYQKTPARIILELIKKAEFKPQDVFFDLGSGLGQVAILVHLLTSVVSKGVEFEPAFCNYAKACAADLNLNDVDFINIDARYADYSLGTIFFMYTPFEGKMLQDVLQNLSGEAKKRKIKIFTYGPCTPAVAQQNWLINKCEVQNCLGEFGEFFSV